MSSIVTYGAVCLRGGGVAAAVRGAGGSLCCVLGPAAATAATSRYGALASQTEITSCYERTEEEWKGAEWNHNDGSAGIARGKRCVG